MTNNLSPENIQTNIHKVLSNLGNSPESLSDITTVTKVLNSVKEELQVLSSLSNKEIPYEHYTNNRIPFYLKLNELQRDEYNENLFKLQINLFESTPPSNQELTKLYKTFSYCDSTGIKYSNIIKLFKYLFEKYIPLQIESFLEDPLLHMDPNQKYTQHNSKRKAYPAEMDSPQDFQIKLFPIYSLLLSLDLNILQQLPLNSFKWPLSLIHKEIEVQEKQLLKLNKNNSSISTISERTEFLNKIYINKKISFLKKLPVYKVYLATKKGPLSLEHCAALTKVPHYCYYNTDTYPKVLLLEHLFSVILDINASKLRTPSTDAPLKKGVFPHFTFLEFVEHLNFINSYAFLDTTILNRIRHHLNENSVFTKLKNTEKFDVDKTLLIKTLIVFENTLDFYEDNYSINGESLTATEIEEVYLKYSKLEKSLEKKPLESNNTKEGIELIIRFILKCHMNSLLESNPTILNIEHITRAIYSESKSTIHKLLRQFPNSSAIPEWLSTQDDFLIGTLLSSEFLSYTKIPFSYKKDYLKELANTLSSNPIFRELIPTKHSFNGLSETYTNSDPSKLSCFLNKLMTTDVDLLNTSPILFSTDTLTKEELYKSAQTELQYVYNFFRDPNYKEELNKILLNSDNRRTVSMTMLFIFMDFKVPLKHILSVTKSYNNILPLSIWFRRNENFFKTRPKLKHHFILHTMIKYDVQPGWISDDLSRDIYLSIYTEIIKTFTSTTSK